MRIRIACECTRRLPSRESALRMRFVPEQTTKAVSPRGRDAALAAGLTLVVRQAYLAAGQHNRRMVPEDQFDLNQSKLVRI